MVPARQAVRRLVVEDTSYRTRPKAADAASESGAKEPLQILILGEANICRSPNNTNKQKSTINTQQQQ